MLSSESIDAVLFDWGHTLFETGSSVAFLVDLARAAGHRASAHDLEACWEAARVRSRSAEELAKGRDLSPELHRACWFALWAELDALVPGAAAALYEHETSAAGWQPYPDTRAVLEGLASRGVPVVVVSDVAFDLRPIFDHYGLRHLAKDFVLSGEHGTIKPDGTLFTIALGLAGVSADRALMVGDNPANDGTAAAVGIRTLLLPVTPPGTPRGLGAVLRLVDHAREG